MKKDLNNTAIKVLSEEHGKRVIQWWKDQGVEVRALNGSIVNWYYGLFNWTFDWRSEKEVLKLNIKVIELPEEPVTETNNNLLKDTSICTTGKLIAESMKDKESIEFEKMITQQDNKLVAFLKKEGVYDEFVENFDSRFNGNKFTLIEYLNSYNEDQDAINCAFNWDETDNPYFWNELEDKWHLFLSSKPEKTFPREMWVWDDDISTASPKKIEGKLNLEYGYIVADRTNNKVFVGFKNACELDEIEQISAEEAEKRLNELTGKLVRIKQ